MMMITKAIHQPILLVVVGLLIACCNCEKNENNNDGFTKVLDDYKVLGLMQVHNNDQSPPQSYTVTTVENEEAENDDNMDLMMAPVREYLRRGLLNALNGEAVVSTAATEDPEGYNNNEIDNIDTEQIIAGVEFEDLLENAVIKLNDFQMSTGNVFGNSLQAALNIYNIRCRNIQVGDIQSDSSRPNNQGVNLDMSIEDIGVDCGMDYTWTLNLLGLTDSGHADVRSSNSRASARLRFESEDLTVTPPQTSRTVNCNPYIDVADFTFTGGSVTSSILNWFTTAVPLELNNLLSGTVCRQVDSLSTSFAGHAVDWAYNKIMELGEPVPAWRLDPTFPESTMEVPSDIRLANFQTPDTKVERLMHNVIYRYNNYFKAQKSVGPELPEGIEAEGGIVKTTLGVNNVIKSYLLDVDGLFSLLFPDNPVLFRGHDLLTITRVTLDSVQFKGLDTVRDFVPIEDVGQHTYQSGVGWDNLGIAIKTKIHFRPSDEDNSIVDSEETQSRSGGVPQAVVEDFDIEFGFNNIDLRTAVLMAVDAQQLRQSSWSLMYPQNIFPCLFAAIQQVGVAGLDVKIGGLTQPRTSRLRSPILNRMAPTFVGAAYLMYQHVILPIMPHIFQTAIRDKLSRELQRASTTAVCPRVSFMDVLTNYAQKLYDMVLNFNGGGDDNNRAATDDDDDLFELPPMFDIPLFD